MDHDKWLSEVKSGAINAKSLIERIVQQDNKFVWHPLGFIMCKLLDKKEKKIRLHIWPKNKGRVQEPAWMIHDHLFDLKSWVLTGNIANIEYEQIDRKGPRRLYHASYQGDSSLLTRTDKLLDVREVKSTTVKSGECYELGAGILHQSISTGNGTAVTVCETVDRLSRLPRVVGTMTGQQQYTYKRSVVSEIDLLNILETI